MSDERAKMAQMNSWLDDVCKELGVNRSVMTDATGPLLALIKHVAHGPSRPGAPLTAFAVGLASGLATAGADGDTAQTPVSSEDVESRIAQLETLVTQWRAANPSEPTA